MADEKPKVTSQSSARERFEKAKQKRTTPRTPSPTRAIEPGMVHYRIAEALLTSAQARAETAGIKLDVGEFPNRGETIPADDDPERISKLTAHAVARISDHFPAFRKFSRHLEGTEKRAGLLSDLFAVVAALYKRNPDAIEDLARQFTTELQSRRAERASTNNGGTNATSSPMTQGKPKPGGIRAT